MDTNIYYIPQDKAVVVTSNFTKNQKWMDLGVNQKVDYIPINTSDISKFEIESVGLDKVDNIFFQTINGIFSKVKLESISFHESNIDLSEIIIESKHLFVGDKTKINLASQNFKNLEEVNFLSVKSFKGKVLDEFETVKKMVLWDSVKTFSLPGMFPNLNELTVNKGSLTELDLRNNKELKKIDIHYCTKLEHILLNDDHKLEKIFIKNCKNLDISILPQEISSIWPQRKEKNNLNSVKIKTTGDKEIDNLMINLKKSMEDYMKEANPSYSQKDIDDCIILLSDCTISIFKTHSKEEAMSIVKSTVLKLNALNDRCDGSLIETNEREQIAEIIILAGHKMKYNSIDEDITEEWREW